MAAADTDLRVFEDLPALSAAAARALIEIAKAAIEERGRFVLALAGGNTPRELYRLLADQHADELPWQHVHWFWSDERFVGPDDPESNQRMARECFAPLSLPERGWHPPDTSLASPEETAALYERELVPYLPMDVVLLGLGEDGHIASLFPGAPALEETERLVVAVRDSPKPPPLRVTMTLPAIHRSRAVHFLVSGERKRETLARTLSGESPPLPASRVQPAGGKVTWWVDRAAAP
jgi:6-phosphogluconolactonase